jgi:aryl-alcohol dehydrogenase-like predicted oxidoreductase
MTLRARLGLGTAQFGSLYGISNREGQPDEREVAAILEGAIAAGIDLLDTASVYGEAEVTVGRLLGGRPMRIISKVPAVQAGTIEARDGEAWLDAAEQSLERLCIDRLDALLVHRAADFAKPGWQHLRDALVTAKERGLTLRIGASIYNNEQFDLIDSRLDMKVVQLPLNGLDRRAIQSGLLARLAGGGVEIHARSVFLQGLLLMAPEDLPAYFRPARREISELQQRWEANGLSALAGCLAFAAQRPEVDRIIVGVNRRRELDEIVAAFQQAGRNAVDFGPAPNLPATYLDPSQWPKAVA